MMIYAKKLTDHDVNKQISIPKQVVTNFIQNSTNDHKMYFVGKKTQQKGVVLLKMATDPRLGGDIKTVIAAEGSGSFEAGNIMVLGKAGANNFILELIKPGDSRFVVWNDMFIKGDDHVLLFDDQDSNSNDVDLSYLPYLGNNEFANQAIRIMIDYDLFDQGLLDKMQDPDWSKTYIRRILPLLKQIPLDSSEDIIQQERKDSAGNNRYYDIVYRIADQDFIASNNWYTPEKKAFVEFIANELNRRGYNAITNKAIIGAENILFYGVPGSGKSRYVSDHYELNSENTERVVFHPEYSFSDFVGQILPISEGDKVSYPFVPGPFTSILKKAVENTNRKYYLVIEELNRGNAPAIFGDLFQLLDRNEIGESEYEVTNFDIAKEVYHDKYHKIRLPSNLWIIATMNTSDQNVFTLDTAFQRRWNMQLIRNDIKPALHANENIKGSSITWSIFVEIINEKILSTSEQFGSFGDKRLGAYFAKINELGKDRFPGKVLKYLWDDAFKMNHDAVFNDSIKSFDYLIEEYSKPSGDPLQKVLNDEVYKSMLNRINDSSNHEQNETDSTTEESVN